VPECGVLPTVYVAHGFVPPPPPPPPPVETLVGAKVMSPELHAASAAVSPNPVKTLMLVIAKLPSVD
jgi:hypothetical protein